MAEETTQTTLDALLCMTVKDRRAWIYALPEDRVKAMLDDIADLRGQEPEAVTKDVLRIKDSLDARLGYLKRLAVPDHDLTLSLLSKCSKKDMQRRIYPLGEADLARLRGEIEAKDKLTWPERHVKELVAKRTLFLESANRDPELLGLKDLLYLKNEDLDEKLQAMSPEKVELLLLEATMWVQAGQGTTRIWRAVDALTQEVFLRNPFRDCAYSLKTLEQLPAESARSTVSLLPESEVNHLLGASLQRRGIGPVSPMESRLHSWLVQRKHRGVDLDNLMGFPDQAKGFIDGYGHLECNLLLEKWKAKRDEKETLSEAETQVGNWLAEQKSWKHDPALSTITLAEFAPFIGKPFEQVMIEINGLPEQDREHLAELAERCLAFGVTPLGLEEGVLDMIVGDDEPLELGPEAELSPLPEAVSLLLELPESEALDFLQTQEIESLEALSGEVARIDPALLDEEQQCRLAVIERYARSGTREAGMRIG